MDIGEIIIGGIATGALGVASWFANTVFKAKDLSESNAERLTKIEQEMVASAKMGERVVAIETTLKTLDKMPERFASLETELREGQKRTDSGFSSLERLLNRVEAQVIRIQDREGRGAVD